MSGFPKEQGHLNVEMQGYALEARSTADHIAVGSEIFGQQWKRVHIEVNDSGKGMPIGPDDEWHLDLLRKFNLLPYSSVQAMRWLLVSQVGVKVWQFETRIVQHTVKAAYSATATGAINVLCGDEHYGNKQQPAKEDTTHGE